MIDEKKGITRGEFLKTIGGIGLAVVALKFAGVKGIADTIKPNKTKVATISGSYGNNTYGGKSA